MSIGISMPVVIAVLIQQCRNSSGVWTAGVGLKVELTDQWVISFYKCRILIKHHFSVPN